MIKSLLKLSVVLLLLLISLVTIHEIIHSQIATYHGCINGSYGVNLTQGIAYFKCNEYIERSNAVWQQEYLLHSINELISYYLYLCIALYVVFNWRKNE